MQKHVRVHRKKPQVNKGNISGIIIIFKAIRKTRLRAFSSQNILDLPTQMIKLDYYVHTIHVDMIYTYKVN